MTKTIHIKSEEQVEKINRLACQTPYEVWLCTNTLMLDARSLLGLFNLVGQQACVVAEDGVDPERFERLVKNME